MLQQFTNFQVGGYWSLDTMDMLSLMQNVALSDVLQAEYHPETVQFSRSSDSTTEEEYSSLETNSEPFHGASSYGFIGAAASYSDLSNGIGYSHLQKLYENPYSLQEITPTMSRMIRCSSEETSTVLEPQKRKAHQRRATFPSACRPTVLGYANDYLTGGIRDDFVLHDRYSIAPVSNVSYYDEALSYTSQYQCKVSLPNTRLPQLKAKGKASHTRYNCRDPKCETTFSKKCDVARHWVSCHSGIKKFKCEQCPKSFGRKDELTRHTNGNACKTNKQRK